ncbi:hypothetical protein Esti_006337 [Eimeria stiedai]
MKRSAGHVRPADSANTQSAALQTKTLLPSGRERLNVLRLVVISELNEALAFLWPRINREGEIVQLSQGAAEELVETALGEQRKKGKRVSAGLHQLLKWHLATCFSINERAGGLSGLDGLFDFIARSVCPGGSGLSCALTGLKIPLLAQDRTPRQALEVSLCEAAIRSLGCETAASVVAREGLGIPSSTLNLMASEQARMHEADKETQRLFREGVRSQQLHLTTFRMIQWTRFISFHKLASAYRLVQRLFFSPWGDEGRTSGPLKFSTDVTTSALLDLVSCVSEAPCLGMEGAGFKETTEECIKAKGAVDRTSALHSFFVKSSMEAKDSLTAQVLATALLMLDLTLERSNLRNIEGALVMKAEEAYGQRRMPHIWQKLAASASRCSPHSAQALESHLHALRGANEMHTNAKLAALIYLENAKLLFSLNAVSPPSFLSRDYQTLRGAGTSLGLALVRGGSKMIATACGLDRCGSPSATFLNCVEKNLNDIPWDAQRELLKQHMHALVFFARNPALLPLGPRFDTALPEFRTAALRLADSLRTEANAAEGALDNPLPGAAPLAESLNEFLSSLDDNLLSMGVTFLEEGEFSLYGEILQQRVVSTETETCDPSWTNRGALKTFLVMQRLSSHFDQLIGSENLKKVYGITAKKAGLSPRAVESTFVRSNALQIFMRVQSMLDKSGESQAKRLNSNEELINYVVETMAAKLGLRQEEEEASPFGLRVAGDIVALASAIHKEVVRTFARRIAVGAEFGKVFGGDSAPVSVASWLAERFSDFRRSIYPSYVLDAQFGCLQQCVEPLLADTRLQTGCTDDKGRPQPLVKCADPAEQFSKVMRKSIWESSLGGWLKKSKAHPACQQLLQLLNEDEAAWAQQVQLMITHLDTINCGKDHRGYDSYGRFAIKLSMVSHLYNMFASTSERPSMASFIEWLVHLKMPLPQNPETPTSEAILVAGLHFHTQVSVGRAFKAAVKEDPSFSQCKPEETRIISELIPSLSSLFSTLGELNDFLSQQRKQEEVVTRVVAAPPAADARPILEQVMTTFAAAPEGSAEVLVRLPVYFPARVASSFSKGGPQALQMLDYTYTLLHPSYTRELGDKALSKHLVEVTEDAERWVSRNVAACRGAACTAKQAGDRELSVAIEKESAATYTFPATREERAASSVFSWLLPGLPPLRCKLPVSVEQPPILPLVLPPIAPPPMGEAFPPTAEEIAKERASGKQPAETVEPVQPTTPEKEPEEPLKIERLPADSDATDPEELVTARPKEPEEGPQIGPKDDACHTLMRLYYKYIEGKAMKDVDTLHEEALQVPLFRKTREELRLDEGDQTMQSFRLVLCVTCAKHIPAMQLASPEERKRLSASLEESKEACKEVYGKTGWTTEKKGLRCKNERCCIRSGSRAYASLLLSPLSVSFLSAAELASVFGSSTRVGDMPLPPTSLAGGLASWLAMDRGPTDWAQQARRKLKTDAAAAALCAALRFAEFLRQITRQGEGFDRILHLWHLSLPTDSLRLVNSMRTAARQKDVLSQELCTLAPPSPQVQQLVPRFDPQHWAALAMQTETPEETPTAVCCFVCDLRLSQRKLVLPKLDGKKRELPCIAVMVLETAAALREGGAARERMKGRARSSNETCTTAAAAAQ